MIYKYIIFSIIFIPLLSALIQGLFGFKNVKISGILSSLFIFVSFLLHFFILKINHEIVMFPFIAFSDFNVNFSFSINRLNLLMGMMVSFVSFLVHFYSIGYMEKDESPYRYFSFLSLFVFFMLLIVYSGNFLLMFVGWEGVGLCSYLLISYETWRDDAKNAGTKAFYITRFADFGFILFLLFYYKIFKTFEISALSNPFSNSLIPLLLIFALIAAAGKSAQFPFYVWLPDAMEGPTPVSALIHAATMVTAGVWLMIKLSPLFSLYPYVLNYVLYTGLFTLLISGIFAIFEKDLKRILAYSTISQIGYMFFAVGLGYPLLAFLHLLTHAFFKALLFLSSGNVMHIIHRKINIFEIRGIRKVSPFTAFSFLIGAFALAGFPLTGGFISKELILQSSFDKINLFYLAVLGVFLTSFYIMRGYALCFEGEKTLNKYGKNTIYQDFSLLILMIFVFLTGLPIFEDFYFKYFRSVFHFELPFLYSFLPLFLMALGIYLAFEIYTSEKLRFGKEKTLLFKFFENAFYYDHFISRFIFEFIRKISEFTYKFFDKMFIDSGIVEGTARFIYSLGNLTNVFFKRRVSFYILIVLISLFLFLIKIA